MESKGFVFPKMLKTAFVNLYTYTNQPDTGIRHALMDEDGNMSLVKKRHCSCWCLVVLFELFEKKEVSS